MIIKVLITTASISSCICEIDFSCLGKFKMERRLNFDVMIPHLFLKTKRPNDQIGKILCPRFIKTVTKTNLLA